AIRAGAVEARIGVGDVVADRALADFFLGVANGLGQSEGVLGRGAKEVKRKALSGFLANAGEMLKFIDQAFDWGGEIGHEKCVAQGRSRRKLATRSARRRERKPGF